MEPLLFLSIIFSFIITIIFLIYWIKKSNQIGLVWRDMNKVSKEKVGGSGGLAVVLGFIMGVLVYIAIQTFYFNSSYNLVEIFSLTTAILLLGGIGIIDDLLGWQHGGLSIRSRLIMVLFAAIPLMVINAGNSHIYIPYFGSTNVGILYPLLFIPIGIIGASTTFNFLAGYNGLEAGQGILILSALAMLSYLNGQTWLTLISLCMIVSLFGFLFFNKYPSKVFPGDVLTYPVGGLIAIMAILGNFELFTVFIFIPYIIETGLKLRGRLKKYSFGEPQKDGSLKNKYNKIYGLEHFAIYIIEQIKESKKAYEWEVVLFVHTIQLIFIILAFLIFVF